MRQGLAGNRAERWTRRRAKPRNFYALFTYTEHPYTYLSGGAEKDIVEKRVDMSSDGGGRFFEVYEIEGAAIVEGLRSTTGVIEHPTVLS
jgi:hypothetical protein